MYKKQIIVVRIYVFVLLVLFSSGRLLLKCYTLQSLKTCKFFIYYRSAARAEGAMSAYLRHEERGGGRRGRRGGQQLGAGRRGAGRRAARVEHVHVRLLYVCNSDTTRSHASRASRASLARRPSERLLFWKLEVTRTDSKIIDLK